jgi:hypothetical protein
MPKMNVIELSPVEAKVFNRLKMYRRAVQIVGTFFDLGFRNFSAVKSIVTFYYPNINQSALNLYWNFRMMPEDVADALEDVIEKLKAE